MITIFVTICTGLALILTLLLTLQAYESRRYARSRTRADQRQTIPWQRVALFVPCKGYELGLRENLTSLFEQEYGNFEIVFVLEGRHDPALHVIERLMAEHPAIPTRYVFAGRAEDSGQKVHNLYVATSDLPMNVQVLAFVDSDARPHRDWLRSLVSGLNADSEAAACTGYRWMIPARNTWANLVLYSINSATASLYGPGKHLLVWGGAWAIGRDAFLRAGIREAWRGTLSDDLVASRALRVAQHGTRFEPRCVIASAYDVSPIGMVEFLRRQLFIGRRYAYGLFTAAFVTTSISFVGTWGALLTGSYHVLMGRSSGCYGIAGFVLLYVIGVVRSYLRQGLAECFAPHHFRRLVAARRFDLFVGPLLGPVLAFAFVAACTGNQITWRGIRYFIMPSGHIQLIGRRPLPGESSDIPSVDVIEPATPTRRVA